ncbi:MAG: homocysteine S-methyltransferase family protein [Clostridia bacterium]|nr:homocysteine S-methyltransferase family protein [Clostridia bacterium]
MKFLEFLQSNIVILDGALGTLLQARGLQPGEYPERWNLSHPEVLVDIHRQYYDAGSNVVCTNTFGANSLKFGHEELEQLIQAALKNARTAAEQSSSSAEKFVALDIGPTGRMLRPLGDLDFEEAVAVFAETVRLGEKYGADLILIETMNDSYETKAALLAAKENSSLPVLVSNAYGDDGKLMTGASPSAMVAMLEGMGADALGANCSLGPRQLRGVVEELLRVASVPVLLKPNAGLPRVENGNTVFDVTVDEFADEVASLAAAGVRAVGGCCGTTPAYVKALSARLAGRTPVPLTDKAVTTVSSYTHTVTFGKEPLLIGERINPTGKKRFKQALVERDMGYLLNEGLRQQEAGVHVLDVNVGLPEIDEVAMLRDAVCELQAVTDLPLQIDTANPTAMEAALRRVNGKALVNSVSGKKESMAAVFPLVKKYGGVVVALTLDDDGIPTTAEERVAIARRILDTAAQYGIAKKNIIFDTLAMTVSADAAAAAVTLEALRRIRQELGCYTSLGVSNVSFGLPARDAVNSTFFTLALASGLSAAIMNPYSVDMRKAYYAYRALNGMDTNCEEYIRQSAGFATVAAAPTAATAVINGRSALQDAIVKGLQEQAGSLTEALLQTEAPLDIVNKEIIPALNAVGEGYEKKTVYLPQLLMSAEAAKRAFESIKKTMTAAENTVTKGAFVLATVRGDIHDIGKNIVRLLLENYGYQVIDLGRDVPPEAVVDAVEQHHAAVVGLSALMTTTVPAMEETVKLLRARTPWCKIIVGGAVLTQEYADAIGADHYGRDAMEAVRYAEAIIKA